MGTTDSRGGSRTAPAPNSNGAEPFDPFKVGKMGSHAIRGRQVPKACPCPRLLNSIPFGVPTAGGGSCYRPPRRPSAAVKGTYFEPRLQMM